MLTAALIMDNELYHLKNIDDWLELCLNFKNCNGLKIPDFTLQAEKLKF